MTMQRRGQVAKCVVPGPLFVTVGRVVVLRIVVRTELNPSGSAESKMECVANCRQCQLPWSREVLALVEFHDEAWVGDPEIAGR